MRKSNSKKSAPKMSSHLKISPRQKLDMEQKQTAKELYEKNYSIRAIARFYNVSESTAARAVGKDY